MLSLLSKEELRDSAGDHDEAQKSMLNSNYESLVHEIIKGKNAWL